MMEVHQSLFLLFLLFLTYYFIFVAQKIRIYAGNKSQLEFLSRFQTLKEIYYPTIFYFHGILQTIFGLEKRMKSRPVDRLPYIREIFTLADGGEIALDFMPTKDKETPSNRKLLTIILPGLTSSSQTSYVKTLVITSVQAGSSVVVINNRGLAGVPLKTPRTFCASNYEDVAEIMSYLKQKFPHHKRIAVGTSLGGIVLSHYLSRKQEEAKDILTSALLISIVWDAHIATASIEKPITKYFVNYALADSLKALVKRHRLILESSGWNCDNILKNSKTLRDFDQNFTAPQFHYKNVQEYYDDVTVVDRIKDFSIPVFGLTAQDDPMAPGWALPKKEAEAKESNLALIVTARGGHLGFLEGFLPMSKPIHFMERFVHEFLLSSQLQ